MPTKMKFHFWTKNETKVTCAELSYGSIANIAFLAKRKWHFWNENTK